MKSDARLQPHGRIGARCNSDMENDLNKQPERIRCTGTYWENGKFTGGCGDPCSFIMRKGGSGDPDFLSEDQFMRELRFLIQRTGRWNDANRS